MTGRTLGHYELLDEIGRGGMGVVYKARDTRLDRMIAIKLLPPDKMSDPDRRRRFVQEAKAASALNHPNIVTIHEIDALDGVDFIVMEHVDGTPLDRLIPSEGLPLLQAVSYAVQIADALAAAIRPESFIGTSSRAMSWSQPRGAAKFWISAWPS